MLSRIVPENSPAKTQNLKRYQDISAALPAYAFKLKYLAIDELNLYH